MTQYDPAQHQRAIPPPPGWAPPPPPRRARMGWVGALAVAVVLLVASAVAGAGVEVALRPSSSGSNASRPSRFTAPVAPFDNGQGSSAPSGSGFAAGGSGSASGGADVAGIAARVNPAIVNIATTTESGNQAAGTGMVITSSGEVLTNNHVIAGASKIQVEIGVTGEQHSASVVGYNVADDVALLKISGASPMKTIAIGSASGVQIDDPVVAIGNALGQFGTPTAVGGVVTNVGRTITAGDRAAETETLTDMIEIRASIQPGDSGGPLVDSSGKIIGMNTAADTGASRFGYRAGNTGFAIPIDKAMSIVHRIEAGDGSGGVHIGSSRALIGVVLDTSANSASGAAVAQVQSGGPADSAGLQAGDVIVSLGGTSVGSANELRAALEPHRVGDDVKVGWLDSSGAQHRATVKLAAGPPA